MSESIEIVGPALRALRERAGLSQRELAASCRAQLPECRLTQGLISRWERGESFPTFAGLTQLLVGLGCDLVDLQRLLGETTGASPEVAQGRLALEIAAVLRDLGLRVDRLEDQVDQLAAERASQRPRPGANAEPGR